MFTLHHATLMAAHRPTGDGDEIFDAHVLACVLASALETAAAGEGSVMSETGLDAATLRGVIDHWFPFAERGGLSLDDTEGQAPEMEEEMLRDLLLAHRAGRGMATDHSGASCDRGAATPLPVPPPQGGRGREGMGSSHEGGRADPMSVASIAGTTTTGQSVTVANVGATGSSPPLWGRDREGGTGLASIADTPGEPCAGPASPHLPTLLAHVIARRAMKPDHLWQDLGLFDRSELNRLLARHFPTLHAGNTANMKWKKYFYRKLCEAEGFVLCTAPSCAQCSDFTVCFGAEDGESRMAKARLAVDRAAAE